MMTGTYAERTAELFALWEKSEKEGRLLYVGLDGQKPDVPVNGVRVNEENGDTEFKTGYGHAADWYGITAAVWEFKLDDR